MQQTRHIAETERVLGTASVNNHLDVETKTFVESAVKTAMRSATP